MHFDCQKMGKLQRGLEFSGGHGRYCRIRTVTGTGSIRRLYSNAFLEDRLRININAFAVVATAGDIERQCPIHYRHCRKKRLAVTKRTKDWPAVWFQKIRHVKSLNMACREIAVHLSTVRRPYHADIMQHCQLLSVNGPVNPLRLFTPTGEIPVCKKFLCVRNAPAKNAMQ